MNVQHTLTTAHLTPTVRMRLGHSNVHVGRDLRETENHAMVCSVVLSLLTTRESSLADS